VPRFGLKKLALQLATATAAATVIVGVVAPSSTHQPINPSKCGQLPAWQIGQKACNFTTRILCELWRDANGVKMI